MKIQKFEDLECWQAARELSLFVIEKSNSNQFKNDKELFKQINSSAGSAMDNIAEGFGRSGNREFKNFLSISLGSSNECKSQIIRAYDKKYITSEELIQGKKLADITINKTGGLLHYLCNSNYKGRKYK